MKILIYMECMGENAIFVQFYVILLEYHDLHNRKNWSTSRSNNRKLPAKFHSRTLRIMDTSRHAHVIFPFFSSFYFPSRTRQTIIQLHI